MFNFNYNIYDEEEELFESSLSEMEQLIQDIKLALAKTIEEKAIDLADSISINDDSAKQIYTNRMLTAINGIELLDQMVVVGNHAFIKEYLLKKDNCLIEPEEKQPSVDPIFGCCCQNDIEEECDMNATVQLTISEVKSIKDYVQTCTKTKTSSEMIAEIMRKREEERKNNEYTE